MTDTTAAQPVVDRDAVLRLLARHRFHASSNPELGFCGAPYCDTGLVTIATHEAHLAEAILFALVAQQPAPESAPEERWYCDVAGGEVTGQVSHCCRLERRTVTPWTPVPPAALDERGQGCDTEAGK